MQFIGKHSLFYFKHKANTRSSFSFLFFKVFQVNARSKDTSRVVKEERMHGTILLLFCQYIHNIGPNDLTMVTKVFSDKLIIYFPLSICYSSNAKKRLCTLLTQTLALCPYIY